MHFRYRSFFVLTTISATALLVSCASPQVVSVRQTGDADLNYKQIQESFADAQDFEMKARKERGVTGTNVAAAVFFWPALLGTYANTEEAISASRDRQRVLEKLALEKQCKL